MEKRPGSYGGGAAGRGAGEARSRRAAPRSGSPPHILKRLALSLAVGISLIAMPAAASAQGWYPGNWGYRKRITIDATMVAGNLTDFPILLDFTDTDLRDKARSDFFDVLFTDSTGTAKLSHDIEDYDSGTGLLTVWVEVTSLSGSADTDIYMYYGNPGASDQEDEPGTWSDNYEAVYHLHNNSFADAAGNHDGSNGGSNNATGIAGDGRNFVRPNDYVDTDWAPSSFTGAYTFEGWFRALGQSSSGDIWGVEDRLLGDSSEIRLAIRDTDANNEADSYNIEIRADAGVGLSAAGLLPGNPDDGLWHHIALIRTGSVGRLFYDGVYITLTDSATSSSTSSYPSPRTILIGAQWETDAGAPPGTRNEFDGDLDETRISLTARPQEYFQTQVANVNNSAPGGFYDFLTGEETGLIGHWNFNEGSGQVAADASPSNNDGTLGPTASVESGDPTWACSGTALDFDGSDDEVKLSSVAIGDRAAWSISAWIKMGPDAADKRTIYGEGDTTQREFLYLDVAESGSYVTFYSEDFPGSVNTELNGTTNVEDDAWHLVTVVQRSKTDRELYVDTNSEDTNSQNAGTLSFNTASIGYLRSDGWVADPFKGTIDDVRIFDYALSPAEIDTLYAYPPGACAAAGGGDVLLLVSDDVSPEPVDDSLKAYLESQGLTVRFANDNLTAAQIQDTITTHGIDVLYVSQTCQSSTVDDGNLTNLTTGIVMANVGNWDGFELTNNDSETTGPTTGNIVDNSHYITEPFSTGNLTLYSSATPLGFGYMGVGSGADVLMTVPGQPDSVLIIAYETAATLETGNPADGRRVGFFAESEDWQYFTDDTKTLIYRSIIWGGGLSGGGGGNAVTSATAEISPNDVVTSSLNNEFIYAILATISGAATGVDSVEITVPATYGNPTVDSVRVGGAAVTYTDNTSGKLISITLDTKVTATDSILVFFTADAPSSGDGGVDFLSTVDDSSTPEVPQSTTEGDADGDAPDNNSWTVTTAAPFTVNYRSIGMTAGILYQLGTASITANTSTVTFSGATLPTTIGVGDKLVIGGTTFFILSRNSSSEVTVQETAVSSLDASYEIRRAYNTLQSWEDPCGASPCLRTSSGGRGGDLVADNRREVGVAYNDAPFTMIVIIEANVVDATHYMTLTVEEGQRHDGTAGSGVVIDPNNLAGGFRASNDYTVFEWFEITRTGGDNGRPAVGVENASNVVLSNLLIHDYVTGFSAFGIKGSDNSNFTVHNCIIYNGQSSGIRLNQATAVATVENCTVYGITGNGITQDAGTLTVTNSISMGNTGSDFVGGTQSNNMSDDGTASGSGSIPNGNPSTQFVNVAVGDTTNWDLHLIAGSDAIDAGTPLSFSDDIDGDTRPIGGGWDMGADETNAAPGSPAVSSATAEISPNDVTTSSTGNEFVYAILPVVGSGTGVDSIEITVPATHGDPTVDSVRVDGTAVTYTDHTAAKLISITLDTKVTADDSIQVYFTADAPTTADAGVDFTSTVDDSGTGAAGQSTTEGDADGDAGDANDWTVTTSDPNPAVTSATAEIWPNDVTTGFIGVEYIYAILATISGGETGVDRVEIEVPTTFGLPTVDSVRVGGTAVTYTDNTGGTRTISVDLDTKVTSTDSIQVYFTADAPSLADPAGKDFTSTVDDKGTGSPAQSTTEGNGDGDAGDANDWTVTTTDMGGGGGTPAGICPAVDTVFTSSTIDSMATFQHTTTSGPDRLMLVGVSLDNDNFEYVDWITYNGTPLSYLASEANSDDARVEIWQLVDPDPGEHDVVIKFNADLLVSAVVGAITFTGADQTPIASADSAFADSPTSSVTVSSAVGELVFAIMSGETTGLPVLQNSPPAAEQWNDSVTAVSPAEYGAAATDTGQASVTVSWTHANDHWAAAGASIAPATACLNAAPTISSNANQSFGVGDPITVAERIVITEDASYMTITATNDIRITIPAGLDMVWDTSLTTVTIGGASGSKVSPTLLPFEDSGKTAVLNVTQDFAGGDQFYIDSLKFRDFDSVSAADSLELEVGDDGIVSAVDDKTKEITAPANPAVTSATAEISPNDVVTSSLANEFIYAILATISGGETGVDSVEITVPGTFGLPAVDSVRVGGTAVAYTDNTGGTRTISVTLDTKVSSTDSIQVYFTADAPTSSDATGVDFTSTVDDKDTGYAPQATTEGDADGDAGDANSWTVTTSGAVSSALAEIAPNDVLTSSTGNEFIYAILATITGDDTGVDSLTITVPATFGDPVVDSVRVGGTAVTYTDNTAAKLISINLDTKLASTDSIQVYFTADAPTSPEPGGQFFTSTVADTGTSTPAQPAIQGSADGDGADANSWNVTTTDPQAVTSATAEIWPNDVIEGTIDNAFVYAILATIGGGDSGVDSVEVTVPAIFGDPTVNDVRVGGISVGYTDGTAGKIISLKLTSKVTSTDSIQVYFSADAPASADAGQDFTSKVDDTTTGSAAQSTTEGNGDGDAGDANDWTVVTSSAGPADLIGRYCFNEASSGTGPTQVLDDQASPLHMDITYGTPISMQWIEVSGHRGLGDPDHNGITRAAAAGTKYVTALDGATQASLVFVVSWDAGASDKLAGFMEDDGTPISSISTTAVGLMWNMPTRRPVWNGVWDDGTRRVFHFVYDAANATQTERMRLYVDGVDQGQPDSWSSGTWPTLDEGLDFGQTTVEIVALNEIDLAEGTPGYFFYYDVRDGALTDAEAASSATDLLADDDCGGGSGDPAVTSAVAEIAPNDVETSSTGNEFIYAILATIGGGDTGVDRVEIPVPGSFGLPTVDSVRVGGTSVTYTDNTASRQISVDLNTKVTTTDSIQIYFTADAPTSADPTGQNFTSMVDDTATASSPQASTEGNGDGDASDANSWTVTTTDGIPAVTSATAEIAPNDVVTSSTGNEFIYAILATISGGETGVDSVEITVPGTFGLPTVDSVRVGGTAVTYTDNTGGTRTISVTLDTKVTSTDSIQVYFTADAPTSSDATGVDFTSTVDDKDTGYAPQATTEGSADGDAGDANDWTVTTSGAVSTAVAEISPNDVETSSTGNEFIYAILATISGDDSGVDSIEVTVPATFGDPTVDSVRVGGTAVTYTDYTAAKLISITLDTKVASTDSIQVYFAADAPSAPDAGGQDFTSTVDDKGTGTPAQATAEGSADGDGADANSWTVTTSDPGAVTSAVAEISPNDVFTSSTGNEFVYAILATIGGSDTGVDSVEVTVPATFGLPTVDSVRVGGTAVTYTDNTGATRTISVTLDTKVTSTDSIQVYFTADAPTSPDGTGVDFTSTVDDKSTGTAPQAATEGSADGDAGDNNSWTVTTTDPGPAVTSATAEIWPNDVIEGTIDNAFVYAILATIGGGDTGVDSVEITVPAIFGDPTVNDVRVGGSSVAYTDGTAGKIISLKLTSKVTSTDSIQVYFYADAPASADAGQDFTSKVDDTTTGSAAQSTTEGNGDGDAGDNNDWTVVTTAAGGAPANLIGRYCFNEAASGRGPTQVLDDQASPVHMDITYGTVDSMSWTEVGGNRGLGAATHTGITQGNAAGSKYVSTLDGATQATMVWVTEWTGGSSDRIVGFMENDGSRIWYVITASGDVEVRYQTYSQVLRLRWGSGAWGDGTRRVFHAVYDAANATQTERLRLYVNGADQGAPTFVAGTWPTQTEGLDFSPATVEIISLNEIDTTNPVPGHVFYFDVRDAALSDAEALASYTALDADDDCGGGGSGGNAVTTAVAEIAPNDVETSSTGNEFIYAILATIGGGDTGFERVEIPVPGSFGLPTVDSVRVGGTSVTYTDNTASRQISVDLNTKVTTTDSVQIYFTADAPTTADATGQNFTSMVDDTATATSPQASTEGNGDGDAGDNNSWTVTTTDAPAATLLGRYWFNEAPSGQTPTTVYDDQASPVNLGTTYDTPVGWTLLNGHRGFGSTAGGHSGAATASATATKYPTNLDGATQASFVTVAEWGTSSSAQRIAGFQDGADPVATFRAESDGELVIYVRTTVDIYDVSWGTAWADGTRRTFHVVYDSDNTTQESRIRLYVDGVDQGAGTPGSGWPAQGEALDFTGTLDITIANRAELDRGLNGTVFYYAVYDGELTDSEISTNAAALDTDDDNITPAVTVTPDGAAVTRQAGTEYTQEFTIANGAGVTDDFDLLAWTGPAVSFITIDSITFNGLSFVTPPDSARLVGLAASTSDTATVWYTVASSTDGRVDTLFIRARSVTDNAVVDTGSVEVEYSDPAVLLGRYWFNEAPSGQTPTTVYDDQASPVNLTTIVYDTPVEWTVDDGHRGLNGSTDPHVGIAYATASGTKYTTNLDGALEATFVAVAEWAPAAGSQRIAGFVRSGGARAAELVPASVGGLSIRIMTQAQSITARWPSVPSDSTRRVFHVVYDADNPVDSLRIRLYVNGSLMPAPTLDSGTWPITTDGLDFSDADILLTAANNTPGDATNPLNGTVFYYAVYVGSLTDGEISTNATALLADDDSYTPTVSVTPDGLGSPVLRQAGTDYSQDFAVTNNSTLIDDFDLLTSVGPASSFLTVDSITGTNVTQGADPDSARLTGVAASGTDSVTVWYTVAASTPGRVDTLYVQARSITDTTVNDNGYAEVEFQSSATLLGRYWFNEAPSGQGPTTVFDDQASAVNLGITYDTPVNWTVANEHRGIGSPTWNHAGYASVSVAGTKYDTNLNGATQASFATVAEWGSSTTTQRIIGFQDSGARVAIFSIRGNGDMEIWVRTNLDTYAVYWGGGGTWADSTRRVFHFVFDSSEPVQEDRIRLYMNGADQGAGTAASGWPTPGETLNIGASGDLGALNKLGDPTKGLNGTLYYYAVYDGELSDPEISTDYTALNADDDNITPAVTVTPDGAAVIREAGTDYSEDFTIANGAGVTDDFDLLAWTGPAVSFITIDSITFNGLSYTSPPDSARLEGLAGGASDTATVWYTVASSTDGRVDTLFIRARSVTDTTAADTGSVEVEFEDAATLLGRYWFNEAPSGQSPTTIYDDQASPVNMSITYDTPMNWAVNNEHRGLEAAVDHTGRASGAAAGTKYSTNLDNATRASFVLVAQFDATAAYTQRAAGFQRTSDGDRQAMFNENGSLDFRFMTHTQGGEPAIRWDVDIDDGVRRVFHLVWDTEEADSASRVRLYINGVLQSGGYAFDLNWPVQGEALDFSDASLVVSAMNDVTQLDRGLHGTVYYFAVYKGELTDSEISSDYTALNADDDNITPSVAVTPDGLGAPILRQAGTDYSYDFVVQNTSSVLDDYDLLASTDPASSFVSVDSITFNGLSFTSPPDSARIVSLAAGVSDTITIWYTVASDTDGNVDTLYVAGRSVTEAAATDSGHVEIEFDVPVAGTPLVRYWIDEAPSGQGVANLIDSESSPINMPLTYVDSVPYFAGDHGGLRHLRFNGPDATDTGGGVVDVNGTKLDPLHGATQVTLEVKYLMDSCTGQDARVFGVSDGDNSFSGWLAVREWTSRDALVVQWAGQAIGKYALETGCPISTASVVHWVIDTTEPTDSDRVRAYINGVRATVTPIDGAAWPTQNETIDLGAGTRRMFVGRPHTGIRTFKGRIWYAALYAGEMSNAQIASNATALASSDDNNTYAVTVTPDGASVVRLAGTDYSYGFTLNNGSSVLEDFDLLASTDPASSFITIDSITGGGITDSGVADSTRILGVDAAADSTVTVWYTIAADTDGNVDTLYLRGRSISDTTRSNLGWIEIEYETMTVTVAPDGADTLQLMPTGSAASSSYKFTINNNSQVSEMFDLLAFDGTVLTIDSITGPNVSGGSPGDSARTGAIAASAEDSAFVWFTISIGTAGALDSLYLMGRSVSEPTATDSGWVFVELLQPEIATSKLVNPNGTQPPGTDLTYTATVTNNGTADAVGVVTLDSLAVELYYQVGSESSTLPSGMSDSIEFYDGCGSDGWSYTPVSGGGSAPAGYDACVLRIRWTLLNDFSYVGPDNTADLEFVARIK